MSVYLSVRHTFAGLGGNPLSPNSSETAWNFQTPFYRMEAGRLRMVYVNFHKPICPRDFSITIYGRNAALPGAGHCHCHHHMCRTRTAVARFEMRATQKPRPRRVISVIRGPKGQPHVYNTYGWPEGRACFSQGEWPIYMQLAHIYAKLVLAYRPKSNG